MATYEIDHVCGHSETVQIYGTNVRGERERDAAWQASRLCRDCYRDQQRAQAQTAAEEQGLPSLQGTERQIAWAETLRAKALAGVEQLLDATMQRFDAIVAQVDAGADVKLPDGTTREAYVAQIHQHLDAKHAEGLAIRRTLVAETRAAFWIDHRFASADELVNTTATAVRA